MSEHLAFEFVTKGGAVIFKWADGLTAEQASDKAAEWMETPITPGKRQCLRVRTVTGGFAIVLLERLEYIGVELLDEDEVRTPTARAASTSQAGVTVDA